MVERVLPRRATDPAGGNFAVGITVGALGSLVLSCALVPLRDHVANANMALVLVVPVLIGAIVGGRWAGAGSALVAALCFDFFFTLPYSSLRIKNTDDITTFVVFLIVALTAAEVGILARRGGEAAREARSQLDRVYRIADLSSRGADVEDVVSAARAELIGLFELVDCVYEAVPVGPELPRLGHGGALENARLVALGEFVLPSGGVELAVTGRGHDRGRLVLYASELTSAPLEKRMVAVAIADELGTTLVASA
jgi:hypothetical protein